LKNSLPRERKSTPKRYYHSLHLTFIILQFTSLILDDQQLNRSLTADDKKYLEEFKNVEVLSFSNTALKSLENLPDLPELKRVHFNYSLI